MSGLGPSDAIGVRSISQSKKEVSIGLAKEWVRYTRIQQRKYFLKERRIPQTSNAKNVCGRGGSCRKGRQRGWPNLMWCHEM